MFDRSAQAPSTRPLAPPPPPRARQHSGVRPRSRLVLSVLRNALAETTMDERIDDPYLEDLTREVRGGEGRDDAFDYARAYLLRAERPRSRPATLVADWRGALWTLLGHPAPRASLLIDGGRRWLLDGNALDRARRHHEDDLSLAPPSGPLLVGRTDRVVEIAPPPTTENASWCAALAAWEERRALVNAASVDPLGGPRGRVLLLPEGHGAKPDWAALDRTLSGLWRGLRHAAGARAVADLNGGRRLVPLGGGVCAEVAAYRCPRASSGDEPSAAFRTYVEANGLADVFPSTPKAVDGWIGAGIGGRLPRGLRVRGAGLVLEVKLVQALWL